jgi:hypothetical protein
MVSAPCDSVLAAALTGALACSLSVSKSRLVKAVEQIFDKPRVKRLDKFFARGMTELAAAIQMRGCHSPA